jgi:hypothetical protein
LNPDHKAKSDGDPFNPLFHNQVSFSKYLLTATLDVLALTIACLRVFLHPRTSLVAELISRRNQAMAGGICAFVRLFDQVNHILSLQPPLSTSIAPPIYHILFASGFFSGSSSHCGSRRSAGRFFCKSSLSRFIFIFKRHCNWQTIAAPDQKGG